MWDKEPEVELTSRLLVARIFGIDVDTQIRIENEANLDTRSIDLSCFATDADHDFVRRYVMPEAAWCGHDMRPSEVALEIFMTCSQRTREERKAISQTLAATLTKEFAKIERYYVPARGYRPE